MWVFFLSFSLLVTPPPLWLFSSIRHGLASDTAVLTEAGSSLSRCVGAAPVGPCPHIHRVELLDHVLVILLFQDEQTRKPCLRVLAPHEMPTWSPHLLALCVVSTLTSLWGCYGPGPWHMGPRPPPLWGCWGCCLPFSFLADLFPLHFLVTRTHGRTSYWEPSPRRDPWYTFFNIHTV